MIDRCAPQTPVEFGVRHPSFSIISLMSFSCLREFVENSRHPKTPARVREGLVSGFWHRFRSIQGIRGMRSIRSIQGWVLKLAKCVCSCSDLHPRTLQWRLILRTPQDHPKTPQVGTKIPQNRPKTASKRPKTDLKTASRRPKTTSWQIAWPRLPQPGLTRLK